jgi:hypothetical protein
MIKRFLKIFKLEKKEKQNIILGIMNIEQAEEYMSKLN